MAEEKTPFPIEPEATQVKRHATVVSYIYIEEKTRKARPLAIFQFPEGETPSYPRKGESMMFPDPFGMLDIDDVINAHKFADGIYTLIVTITMKSSKKNSPGISLN